MSVGSIHVCFSLVLRQKRGRPCRRRPPPLLAICSISMDSNESSSPHDTIAKSRIRRQSKAKMNMQKRTHKHTGTNATLVYALLVIEDSKSTVE